MRSFFSDQFRRELVRAVARRREKVPHTVPELKATLRDAIKQVERDPRAGRLMRNQIDYPGGRFIIAGYWQIVYRVEDDTLEFMALRHIAL